jgi:hypothetical protein
MALSVDATHLGAINTFVMIEEVSDEGALLFRNLLLKLRAEESFTLGLVIVLELNTVEHPIVIVRHAYF